MNPEERFLHRLAQGKNISQEDYDQMSDYLDAAQLAQALVQRFAITGDMRTLIEAASCYAKAEMPFHALEICSRFPRVGGLRYIIRSLMPRLRTEYYADCPTTRFVGKLMDDAFLVIDLTSGHIDRFDPLFPALEDSTETNFGQKGLQNSTVGI